jgi:hypothetical protein
MSESKLSLRADTSADIQRDPAEQSVGGPSWTWNVEIVGPDEEMNLMVGVQCKNLPLGSKYQFAIPAGATKDGKEWSAIDSGPRVVVRPNEMVAVYATWPADVVTTMTISWWAEGTTPPEGAAIEAMLGIPAGSLEESADVKDKVLFRFE